MKSNLFWTKAIFGALALGFLGFNPQASAVVVSPVQSSADPEGLPLTGAVNLAGSDAAAAAFMQELPAIQALEKTLLPEYTALQNPALMALDPALLQLGNVAPRVYFVSEGAGYHSSLGFNSMPTLPTASTPGITSDAQLIFPDVSSSAPGSLSSANNSVRTPDEPLLPGDFVNLTNFHGNLLDFFLIPYGASGGNAVLTDETARNPDAMQHIVTFLSPDKNYLIFSFEDAVGGGDKDYNDATFALSLDSIPPPSAPEPATWAGLVGLLLMVGAQSLVRRPAVQAAFKRIA